MKNKNMSLLAVNYAFQNTINWGGNNFKLSETSLKEIRNLIDIDNPTKTGGLIWNWFYNKWNKKFFTTQSMEDIGNEFLLNLKNYK